MSISLVSATDAGGFQTSVTIAPPEGVEDGDRLIMLASANDLDEITSLPSGWAVLTEDVIGTDVASYVLTRVADSEPSDYTVEWEGEHWHFLVVIAFRGVEAIRSHEVVSDDSSATIDLPVLQAEPDDALVAYGFNDEETSKNFPAALSEITNLPRGIISAWETPGEGPTDAHTLTCGTSGHIAATAILLAAEPEAPPPPTFPLTIRTELRLGGQWVDISEDVRDTDEVSITRGRSDEASTADASEMTLTLNNRHGRYSPRNPTSPHFGVLGRNTRIRVSIVTNGHTIPRFSGEVAEWPLRWDLSGNDMWVELTANGILRRLNQGEPSERSALRRYIRAQAPISYWPITDGESAVLASPDVGAYDMAPLAGPFPGGNIDFVRIRLDWRSGDLAPWLEDVAQTTGDFGKLTGRSSRDDVSDEWAVDLVRAGPGGDDTLVIHSRHSGDGETQEWQLGFDATAEEITLGVRLLPEDGSTPALTSLDTVVEPRFFLEQARHVRLSVTENSGESDWAIYVDGSLLTEGTTSGFEPPRPVYLAEYRWDIDTEDDAHDHAALGHITIWDMGASPAPPTALDMTQAMRGHQGERAGLRIQRIAEEENLPIRAVGDLELTPPMGPQQTTSPLEAIREAETVDDGMLFEARDEVALVYRTSRSRYNQEGTDT